MRFKALRDGVELPEKASASEYINVRSNERISVCSGDRVRVSTGVHVTVAKNETARIVGPSVVGMTVTTGELFVTVYNPDKQNIKIYPGQVLAEILVKTEPVKVRKPKPRKPRKPRKPKVVTSEPVVSEPVAKELVVSEPRITRLNSSARLVPNGE